MKKESNLIKMDKMVDLMAKGDGTLDFLYFRLKFAMEMIDNFKSLYRYENFFKRNKIGRGKYNKANKTLSEINRVLKKNKDTFVFKDMKFIKGVEDKKQVIIDNITKDRNYSRKDKAFVKRVNDTLENLHYALNLAEEYI